MRTRANLPITEVIKLPQDARYPVPWVLAFLLAGGAWIFTYQQSLGMQSLQMYGTMGMPLGPFLLFWTIMMAAMMLPGLAPIVSIRYRCFRQQSRSLVAQNIDLGIFLLGYLFMWSCFGLLVFFLGLLSNQLVLHAPVVGVALGVIIFISAGIYQMTPLKRRSLAHCNPSMGCYTCTPKDRTDTSPLHALKGGVLHGLTCQCACGNLMVILVAVGLMNLSWMVLITLVVFVEKVWLHADRLTMLLGMALIVYGALSYIDPALLSGLYIQ